MITVVVPFRAGGKSRLPESLRGPVALAMLGDVLTGALATGRTLVVTDDLAGAALARELGATVVPDPGGGQGPAVAAALVQVDGPVLVVNADLPALRSLDLLALAGPALDGRLGLVRAADGTTNALALPSASAFAGLYGAGSADRFAAHARSVGYELEELPIPSLVVDVDTEDDLATLAGLLGPRTAAALAMAVR